jgi:hypothetical protein
VARRRKRVVVTGAAAMESVRADEEDDTDGLCGVRLSPLIFYTT